jgi:PAS domain S-box-containing protein
MPEPVYNVTHRMSEAGSKSDDAVVLAAIAAGTAASTGQEFFAVLVRQVAQAMGTKGAWVTEWLAAERRLRAFSFWFGNGYHGDYEYDVAGTPCEPVVNNRRLSHIPENVVALFPEDPSLADLGAVSYMGVPLLDTDGGLLGHLAVLHDRPLPPNARLEAILTIFAGRAAAELQRLRRERELREREQKLARLFDGAMDAILELDERRVITQVNGAAVRLWGQGLQGGPFARHLTAESASRLEQLFTRIDQEAFETASLFIPDGTECVDASGRTFPVEGTLSRFETEGRPFYCLILRNLDDRVEAERRIRSLTDEAAELRQELTALRGDFEIVGESPAIREVLVEIRQVAATDATVLIAGETGTGKELVAGAIHGLSARAHRRLVKVNCAAIPAALQESEFFGHEKGAFTGAIQRREGRFKIADGGTLFLDEVGELPIDLQAKLLRVLQEGEYEPVGSTRTERVNVRIVAATNRDLRAMVANGTFREDLYYRLNVFPIQLPALRDRGDDAIAIAESLLATLRQQLARPAVRLTPDARCRLQQYDWPGNVRELRNVLERAMITSTDGRTLNLDRALPVGPQPGAMSEPPPPLADRVLTVRELRELDRANTLRALECADWKISGPGGAAERLGIQPNTLASRIKSLGIRRPANS